MTRAEFRRDLRYTPSQVMRHGGAMCLIDAIEDYGPDWIVARVDIRPGCRFCDERGVPAWVGIEYMAQAISAWSGIELTQRGEPPRIGLLVGSRRYDCSVARFAPGSSLRLRADLLYQAEWDLGVFGCSIRQDDTTLAQAQVKVFRPRDIHAFLEDRRPAAGSE